MKLYITEDGSPTLYNNNFKEYYHSKSGALEEAFEKFVNPCKIKELASNNNIKILDIGFGLGYNVIAAIDTALKQNKKCVIEIISLEKNLILNKLKKLKPNLQYYWIINKLKYDSGNFLSILIAFLNNFSASSYSLRFAYNAPIQVHV